MRRNLYRVCTLFLLLFSGVGEGAAQQTTSMGSLHFWGKASGTTAELEWETVQEVTLSHFNVQRSVDGLHFFTLGRLEAKGTPTQQNSRYRFTDTDPGTGHPKVFYRLECVNTTGGVYISRTVALPFDIDKKLVIFNSGNITHTLTFSLQSPKGATTTFFITHHGGKIMSRHPFTYSKGLQRQTLNISHLPQGLYIIRDTEGTLAGRFVKQ